jgi:hypothetical protein
MKKFFVPFLMPLITIKNEPHQFVAWWLIAIFIGLIGLWFPMILAYFNNQSYAAIYGQFLSSKGLAIFSTIILADALAGLILAIKSGLNPITAGIRGLTSVICLIFLLLSILVAVSNTNSDISSRVNIYQFLVCVIAILLASYMYSFRNSDWEEGAHTVQENDDKSTENITESASTTNEALDGTKL